MCSKYLYYQKMCGEYHRIIYGKYLDYQRIRCGEYLHYQRICGEYLHYQKMMR